MSSFLFLYIKEEEGVCTVHECFSSSIIQYRPSPFLFLSGVVVSARISVWQSDRQFVKSPIFVSLPCTVYSIYFEVWSRAESYERIDPLEDHHSYRVCLYSIVVWNFTARQSLPLYIYIYVCGTATGSFRWWCYSTVLRPGLQPYQKEVMLRSPLKAMEWRLERSNGAICRARFNSLDSHSQSIKDDEKSLILWWFSKRATFDESSICSGLNADPLMEDVSLKRLICIRTKLCWWQLIWSRRGLGYIIKSN